MWHVAQPTHQACLWKEKAERGKFVFRRFNHINSNNLGPIFDRPFDSSNRSIRSIKPNWWRNLMPNSTRESQTTLKAVSLMERPSHSCREAAPIATPKGTHRVISSTREQAVRRRRRCRAFGRLRFFDTLCAAWRSWITAETAKALVPVLSDGDELPSVVEHSAGRVSW